MRRLPLLVVMMALSATARAQEGEPPAPPPPHEPFTQGTFTIDAMTTPGSHMGIGFYLSDRVSIRPMFGFGYSELGGAFFNVGADLRVETRPSSSAWSFYGVATGSYRSGQDVAYGARRGQDVYTQQGGQYGAGVGVRRRVHDRLMLVLDARYLRSSSANLSGASFGQLRLDERNQLVASLGLSFALN